MSGDRKSRSTGTGHEPPPETAERPRHFWLPSGDRVRHAFRGRRWLNQKQDTTVCGKGVRLSLPTEEDWFMAPTCLDCNRVLKAEQ